MDPYAEMIRTFRLVIPERGNLGRLICDADGAPDERRAFVLVDEDRGVREYRFGAIRDWSDRLASCFAGLGVEPGDRIVLLLPAGLEIYLCYLAALKLGAVAVPISTLFGVDGVTYRVQDSGTRLVVTYPEARESLTEVRGAVQVLLVGEARSGEASFWDLVDEAPAGFAAPDFPPDAPALIIYSSGTTGPPKGVLHTRSSLTHTIETEKVWTDVRPEDLHWSVADPTWLGGIMTDMLCAWPVGATIVKQRRTGPFDPDEAFDLLARLGVTNLFAPPTAYRMMAKLGSGNRKLEGLRIATSAGEPLNPEVVEWGQEQLGLTILDGYGQTEGIMMATNYHFMPVKPGSMGRPCPGVNLKLLDEQGDPVETGEPGEICVRNDTPMLFREYWGNPEATEKARSGEWYRTGDSAYQDEDGYIHFVGRTDDVIISAGYRIGPFEVESSILKHPAVAESAVVAKPDPRGLRGHIVKAYVVLKAGEWEKDLVVREIQELVRSQLSSSEYPREIEFIDSLPKTRSGKIIRRELRARAAAEA